MPDGTSVTEYRILATSGPNVFLLIHEGADTSDAKCQARVLDLHQKTLFGGFNLHSILARGHWDEYEGQQDVLPDLLSRVIEQKPPAMPS